MVAFDDCDSIEDKKINDSIFKLEQLNLAQAKAGSFIEARPLREQVLPSFHLNIFSGIISTKPSRGRM
jgi:hypothetical protein